MKRIGKIQTYDGAIHDNIQKAKNHLNKVYGNVLLKIGRELANQNYTNVTNYVDDNLETFLLLAQIKDDMTFEKEEEN